MKKILIIASVVLLAIPAWILADPEDTESYQLADFTMEKNDNCGFGGGGMGRGQGGRHHRMGNRPGMGVMMLIRNQEELGLSDDQVDKLESLQQDFQLERIDREAEMKKAQVQLHALLRDDDTGEGDVFRQIDALAGLKAGMHKMRYSHHQAVKGILTEAQLQKLEDLRKTMREERREQRKGRERGQGRRGMHGGGHGF